ncbi:MAG TPA: hypothetical protein VFM65_08595 [Flavobacteriaceae bacterium]|nr:hypothetical protein [Flavobacteriaceae bacterium]
MKNLAKTTVLLLLFVFAACENEPVGKEYTTNYIYVESELYTLLSRVADDDPQTKISCIQFRYSFILFVFDQNQEFLHAVPVHTNEEFSALLENLQAGESISLSYPITGINANGDLIEINTNEALKQAIDNCVDKEIIDDCNGALCAQECAWEITEYNADGLNFEGAVLEIDSDGFLSFYQNNIVYYGTWVTYITDDQLYINIGLYDDGVVGETFNYEWKLDFATSELMVLSNDGTTFTITIDCELPCNEETFAACAFEPGKAVFSLQDYILCFPFTRDREEIINPLEYSFYESQEDAENETNPISATEYTNSTNPQTIYVRSIDVETGEVVDDSLSFIIEAMECP